jgi:hypothetical protein
LAVVVAVAARMMFVVDGRGRSRKTEGFFETPFVCDFLSRVELLVYDS